MVVLSCTTRSFPGTPLDRILARLTWAGFRAAELYLPAGEPLPEAGTLQAALAAAAIALAAVDAGALQGEDTASGLESAAHVGRCALLAQQLQANRVVCDLAIASEPAARETLTRLLAALAEVPVLLCLRNRPEDGEEKRERLLWLAAEHPDRLGLALDAGAARRAGWDAVVEWERLAPTVRHVYATDALGPSPAAPGEGEVRWDELAQRLRERGYSGAVSLWLDEERAYGDPLFAEAELKEARFLVESWFSDAD
jgi:sugar phosphate isomerase/epimerase